MKSLIILSSLILSTFSIATETVYKYEKKEIHHSNTCERISEHFKAMSKAIKAPITVNCKITETTGFFDVYDDVEELSITLDTTRFCESDSYHDVSFSGYSSIALMTITRSLADDVNIRMLGFGGNQMYKTIVPNNEIILNVPVCNN